MLNIVQEYILYIHVYVNYEIAFQNYICLKGHNWSIKIEHCPNQYTLENAAAIFDSDLFK